MTEQSLTAKNLNIVTGASNMNMDTQNEIGESSAPNPPEVNPILIGRNYNLIDKVLVTIDTTPNSTPNQDVPRPRKPCGITFNPLTEQIYITDREYHKVLVYHVSGLFDFSFGERGVCPGRFNRPTGIVYDMKCDRVLVTDKDNHRVQVFTPDGFHIGCIGSRGTLPAQFQFPWGIDVSQHNGVILVADSKNYRLQLFSTNGYFLRQFKPNSPSLGGLTCLRGVAFDNTGNFIYVTDVNNHTIHRLPLDFSRSECIVSNSLWRPSGIAVDENGNLLVADTKNNAVKIFTSEGTLHHTIKSMIQTPTDIVFMKYGLFAIFDFNGRISIV